MRGRWIAMYACAVLAFAAQGCGGGGGGDGDTTTDTVADTTDTAGDTLGDTAGDTSVTDTAGDTPGDTAGDTSVTDTAGDTPGDTAGDTPGDTPGDSEEDGEVTCTPVATSCNDLEVSGALIDEMQVASDPPALTGGTIVAGTYLLTSQTLYTGAGGATGPSGDRSRAVMVFTAGTFERSGEKSWGTGCELDEASGTYSLAGSTVSVVMTCPEAASFSAPFQADATSFTIMDDANVHSTFTIE